MSKLGNLFAWGIENTTSDGTSEPKTQLNPELLAQLFGANQKSDAELMKEAIAVIQDPTVSLENKEIAFDNFEMMIEQLDNANNIESLSLWPSLISLLSASEKSLRLMAAWCCGTAVQNNLKSQEALLKHGGVPQLVELVLGDPDCEVRKKAVYALSSAVRNLEDALRQAVELLPEEMRPRDAKDASDMEGIDALMARLRERVVKE